MDEALHERVRELIAAIPPGRDLPWHRVLRSDGTPAPHLRQRQLALLRTEGVLADGHRVPMRTYQGKGTTEGAVDAAMHQMNPVRRSTLRPSR